MKVTVNVRYLESVVNPEEEVLKKTVEKMGLASVATVKLGRTYQFTLQGTSREEAERTVEELAEQLLVNPSMETYTYELEEA